MHVSLAVAILTMVSLGAAGAYLGHWLPVPAGVLLGTLVTVGAASVAGSSLGLPQVPVPPGATPVLQILLGTMVELRMDRDAFRSGLHALVPASLLAVAITAVAVASALTSVDVLTAMFAAASSGLTEMTTTSMAFGADAVGVAALQMTRVLLAIAIVDVFLESRASKDKGSQDDEEQEDEEQGSSGKTAYLEELRDIGVAAPWAALGGAGSGW